MATGENGKIAVFASDIRVELVRSDAVPCAVLVRPLGRYDTLDLMRVGASEKDPDVRAAATGMLMRRMQIVGAEGLRHFRTGEPVEFATERVAGLPRPVAGKAVFEALSDSDFVGIDAAIAATGSTLDEAKRGN